MSALAFFRRQPALLWRFLGFFQTPYVRFLHALVAVLVILQILSSSALHMNAAGHFVPGPVTWLASRYHMAAGLVALLLSLLLAAASLSRHGLRHFFPYLWGDTEQLKKDLLASLRFKMVPPRPRGLAAAVQGLGLGALLLTVFSGLLWFILWRNGSGFADVPLAVHKVIAPLMGVYLIGHGGMALLHFARWQRKARPQSPS